MKRLYGALVDEAIKVDVPGMEIGTQHKYAFNICVDFKPDDVSMRPAGAGYLQATARQPQILRTCASSRLRLSARRPPLRADQESFRRLTRRSSYTKLELTHRQVFTDGRAFPKKFELPAFLGYSVGRWEGDVFVVETRGFNDKTPLDMIGHPHSEALQVTERFRRGRLRPPGRRDDVRRSADVHEAVHREGPAHAIADQDIFEMFCENEKDRDHLKNANKR